MGRKNRTKVWKSLTTQQPEQEQGTQESEKRREEVFARIVELFGDKFESDVITLILEECDYKESEVIEKLFQLVEGTPHSQPQQESLSLDIIACNILESGNDISTSEEPVDLNQAVDFKETACHTTESGNNILPSQKLEDLFAITDHSKMQSSENQPENSSTVRHTEKVDSVWQTYDYESMSSVFWESCNTEENGPSDKDLALFGSSVLGASHVQDDLQDKVNNLLTDKELSAALAYQSFHAKELEQSAKNTAVWSGKDDSLSSKQCSVSHQNENLPAASVSGICITASTPVNAVRNATNFYTGSCETDSLSVESTYQSGKSGASSNQSSSWQFPRADAPEFYPRFSVSQPYLSDNSAPSSLSQYNYLPKYSQHDGFMQSGFSAMTEDGFGPFAPTYQSRSSFGHISGMGIQPEAPSMPFNQFQPGINRNTGMARYAAKNLYPITLSDTTIKSWTSLNYTAAAINPNQGSSKVAAVNLTPLLTSTAQPSPAQEVQGAAKKMPHSVTESKSTALERIKQRGGRKVVVLMRGLPGSGKSYLASQIKGAGQVFSTDDFFLRGNLYDFAREKLSEAHDWNKRRVCKAMEKGVTPVIVDNTNLELWEMLPYAEMAITRSYDVEILEPNTQWKSKPKLLAKYNSHGVPIESIKRMKDRYESIDVATLVNHAWRRIQNRPVTVPQDSEPVKRIHSATAMMQHAGQKIPQASAMSQQSQAFLSPGQKTLLVKPDQPAQVKPKHAERKRKKKSEKEVTSVKDYCLRLQSEGAKEDEIDAWILLANLSDNEINEIKDYLKCHGNSNSSTTQKKSRSRVVPKTPKKYDSKSTHNLIPTIVSDSSSGRHSALFSKTDSQTKTVKTFSRSQLGQSSVDFPSWDNPQPQRLVKMHAHPAPHLTVEQTNDAESERACGESFIDNNRNTGERSMTDISRESSSVPISEFIKVGEMYTVTDKVMTSTNRSEVRETENNVTDLQGHAYQDSDIVLEETLQGKNIATECKDAPRSTNWDVPRPQRGERTSRCSKRTELERIGVEDASMASMAEHETTGGEDCVDNREPGKRSMDTSIEDSIWALDTEQKAKRQSVGTVEQTNDAESERACGESFIDNNRNTGERSMTDISRESSSVPISEFIKVGEMYTVTDKVMTSTNRSEVRETENNVTDTGRGSYLVLKSDTAETREGRSSDVSRQSSLVSKSDSDEIRQIEKNSVPEVSRKSNLAVHCAEKSEVENDLPVANVESDLKDQSHIGEIKEREKHSKTDMCGQSSLAPSSDRAETGETSLLSRPDTDKDTESDSSECETGDSDVWVEAVEEFKVQSEDEKVMGSLWARSSDRSQSESKSQEAVVISEKREVTVAGTSGEESSQGVEESEDTRKSHSARCIALVDYSSSEEGADDEEQSSRPGACCSSATQLTTPSTGTEVVPEYQHDNIVLASPEVQSGDLLDKVKSLQSPIITGDSSANPVSQTENLAPESEAVFSEDNRSENSEIQLEDNFNELDSLKLPTVNKKLANPALQTENKALESSVVPLSSSEHSTSANFKIQTGDNTENPVDEIESQQLSIDSSARTGAQTEEDTVAESGLQHLSTSEHGRSAGPGLETENLVPLSTSDCNSSAGQETEDITASLQLPSDDKSVCPGLDMGNHNPEMGVAPLSSSEHSRSASPDIGTNGESALNSDSSNPVTSKKRRIKKHKTQILPLFQDEVRVQLTFESWKNFEPEKQILATEQVRNEGVEEEQDSDSDLDMNSHSCASTQTEGKDFGMVLKGTVNPEEGYKILQANDQYKCSENTDIFKRRRWKHTVDKSLMVDISEEPSVDHLYNLFPEVPEAQINEVLEVCRGNVSSALELMLDWGDTIPITPHDRRHLSNETFETGESMKSSGIGVSSCPPSLMDMCMKILPNDCASFEEIQRQVISTGKKRLHRIERSESERLRSISFEDLKYGPPCISDHPPDLSGFDLSDFESSERRGVSSDKSLVDDLEPSFIGDKGEDTAHIESVTNRGPSKDIFPSFPSVFVGEPGAEAKREVDRQEVEGQDAQGDLTLSLPAALISNLQQLFGHLPGTEQDAACTVQLDHDTAFHLYQCLAFSCMAHQRLSEEERIRQLREDEALAQRLQQEEEVDHTLQTIGAMPMPLIHPDIPKTQKRRQGDLMVTSQPISHSTPKGQEPVKLRDIMVKQLEARGDHIAVATKLKREKLLQHFPGVDEILLEEIFEANEYCLETTVNVLSSALGVKRSVSHKLEMSVANEDKTVEAVKQLNLQQALEQNEGYQQLDAFSHPEVKYAELRQEALLHHYMRRDCFRKAHDAHCRGMRDVADFYARLGHKHFDKMKEANMRASQRLLESRYDRLKKEMTLDLHGFHVDEAITALKTVIKNKEKEFQQKPQHKRSSLSPHKRSSLSVITGRGKHSLQGVSRLRPAIIAHLQSTGYRYIEVKPGMFKIQLSPSS